MMHTLPHKDATFPTEKLLPMEAAIHHQGRAKLWFTFVPTARKRDDSGPSNIQPTGRLSLSLRSKVLSSNVANPAAAGSLVLFSLDVTR